MSNTRHCPRCHYNTIIKFGMQNGHQKYRGKHCHKIWQTRRQSQRLEARIWDGYSLEDLKISQLCKKYHLGDDKIREILHKHQVPPIIPSIGNHDVLCMDCTYFGRRNIDEWGLLIIMDAHTNECLYCEELPGHET